MSSEQQVEAAAKALEAALRGVLPSGSPGFAMLARLALDAADRVRAPASFQCVDGAALRSAHRLRAQMALAHHRCATDLSNGFCGPNDGTCHYETLPEPRRVRGCMAQADDLLKAIEARGMSVVWDHDPNLIVTMERKPT